MTKENAKSAMKKQASMAVVAAVNDDEILANNLAASPMISENGIPLIVKHRQKSAVS